MISVDIITLYKIRFASLKKMLTISIFKSIDNPFELKGI